MDDSEQSGQSAITEPVSGDAVDPPSPALSSPSPPSSPGPSSSLPSAPEPPFSAVLLNRGVSKRSNVGPLLRTMAAFACRELAWVGSPGRFSTFGAHGAGSFVPVRRFNTLKEARGYYKDRGCDVLGVEIAPDARAAHLHPFRASTVFLLGEEGCGLRPDEVAACDGLVYVPQYGAGTASLNVVVAAGIVLHHFAVWSGREERGREGGKFDVGGEADEGERRKGGKGVLLLEGDAETREEMDAVRREQRAGGRREREALMDGDLGLGTLDGDEGVQESGGT
ncbi:Alpha/beta knot methyltransferase [Hyaloraphidium curvatum]|nr:Alpha/beta knot methyltransferase [Hyaloraphidium curvatum]